MAFDSSKIERFRESKCDEDRPNTNPSMNASRCRMLATSVRTGSSGSGLGRWLRHRPNRRPLSNASSATMTVATNSGTSLMACDWLAIQAVDHPRFGRAEGDPVPDVALQRDEKLLAALPRFVADVLGSVELRLVREFTDERHVLATGAPQRHAAFGDYTFSEIELSEIQQHLFDDRPVHERDPLGFRLLQDRQCREHAGQRCHRRFVRFVRLAQAEHARMRIQDADPPELFLERKSLRFELDPIGAVDVRSYVRGRGALQVRMTE